MFKHKHLLPATGSNFIVIISFIYSLAGTIIIPIFPVYLKNLLGNAAYAGYFMSIIYFLTLTYILSSTYFLQNFDKYKLLKFSILGEGITYVLLAFIKTPTQLIILEIFRTLFIALNFVVIGLLIRDGSSRKNIGSSEALYFVVVNVSFFIGPIIGGLIANAYNFKSVFYLASIISGLVFLLLLPKKDHKVHFNAGEVKLFSNIKEFFKDKNLAINYFLTVGLMSWAVILYIYSPLYLNSLNIDEKTIGYFLALIVVPLIILEIPIINLTKSFGYRKLLFLGFILIFLFGAAAFFFSNIYIKMLFFILTNIGWAFVEPLKEAYFFKVNKRSNEVKFYPVYKTATDVGLLSGPLIFSSILIFLGFNLMFLIASFSMLIFAVLSLMLKETK